MLPKPPKSYIPCFQCTLNQKKLNLIHHIINLDKTTLAYQVQRIQKELKLPGLIQECDNYITELGLPNIFEIKIKRTKWKKLVKKAILNANEEELKVEIMKSKKLKDSDLLKEGFGIKKYIKQLSLNESRILFKHRCKVTQYVKMNFRNDKIFSRDLWKCDYCVNIDTESHQLWCRKYKHIRENLDLNQNKDLCKYLQKVLALRKKDAESTKKMCDCW